MPRKQYVRLSHAQHLEIQRLFLDGATSHELAEAYNVATSTINDHVRVVRPLLGKTVPKPATPPTLPVEQRKPVADTPTRSKTPHSSGPEPVRHSPRGAFATGLLVGFSFGASVAYGLAMAFLG